MKQITSRQLVLLKAIAVKNNGELLKDSGDYYSPATLGGLLARDSLNLKRLAKYTLKLQMEFIDDIWWLIRNGYIKIQTYPYRLILTDKFNELKVDKEIN